MPEITRRQLLALASAVLPLGCSQQILASDGRLSARHKAPTQKIDPGEHALGLNPGGERDGLLVVPRSYRADTPAPLMLTLHGASGYARRVAGLFSVADELGVIILAPDSRDRTWDAIRGVYGPDIDFINRALAYTFDRCAIDSKRLAIGGFSDGATYALSVGLTNGNLFTHIIACSPGFIVPGTFQGRPKLFVSHGTADNILPINSTSRRLVPELEKAGYPVTYREFDGPHAVPPAIAREALDWLKAK
jgi:phospholipase/carboxylesterase